MVLIAEDSPIFQGMLRHLLRKWGYEVIVAEDGERAWECLSAENAPRLAILDWMMPGMDGVEVCRRVRSMDREPYTYLILLTARSENQYLVEGMDAGADDYLTKPFNAHELRVRLRAGRRILELQEELLRTRDALKRQATHDGLTGALNRTAILEVLDKELARGSRERSPVGIVLADLDHFKAVNDTHGHLAGDEVLRQAAHRMLAQLRNYDSLGRYGGEEFLVVLPGCESAGAASQAERLRESIAGTPFRYGAGEVPVTCSLGISWADFPDPSQAEMLVRRADQALYRAKSRGRNRAEAEPLSEELAIPVP